MHLSLTIRNSRFEIHYDMNNADKIYFWLGIRHWTQRYNIIYNIIANLMLVKNWELYNLTKLACVMILIKIYAQGCHFVFHPFKRAIPVEWLTHSSHAKSSNSMTKSCSTTF